MADRLLKCDVCQSLLDEEDLFCPNCGTEAPTGQADRASSGLGTPGRAGASRVATHNFTCSGCGASMSYDARLGALKCPFCGSTELREEKDAKILAPERVVPFRLTRDQAVASMRQWLGRGFFRPGDLSQEAAVVEMTPVFVPYWVFQARTHTFWTADTDQTPAGARGDWFPLAGEHESDYRGLLVGASGVLSPAETWDICPFQLAEGVPPEKVDLENVTVEQFALARKYARPLAQQGLEQSEAAACRAKYVPGDARNVHVNLRVEALRGEPVLLPVWIMVYRYHDRPYRFLVNGQTGKATGSAPTSWAKIALVSAAAALAALALLAVVAMVSQ